MATTIKLKNGSGAPLATDLVQGEVALDLTNKRIYSENASGVVIEMGTSPSTIDINAGTIDGTIIGGASAAAGTFTTANATTVDTTNIEVTNVKAKDGTASATIADSTGVMTIASSVLTTTDINGGTIDGVTIGGASAGAGTFTTLTADGLTVDDDINMTGESPVLTLTDTTNNTVSFMQTGNSGYLLFSADSTNLAAGSFVRFDVDGNAVTSITDTGIDVTGTVTADGLTVDGSSSGTLNNVNFLNTNSGATTTATRIGLGITNSAGAAYTFIEANEGGVDSFPHLNFYTGSTATKRLEIEDNGDISFYEDTGTTPKLFWDASEETVSIGASTSTGDPLLIIHSEATVLSTHIASNGSLQGKGSLVYVRNDSSTNGAFAGLEFNTTRSGGTEQRAFIVANAEATGFAPSIVFGQRTATAAMTERMRIDSSGMILPGADNTQDLGSSSLQWKDIYLSNGVQGSGDISLITGGNSNTVKADGNLNSLWSVRDNVMDLGRTSTRWKNLYLGGSVYLGGTTSANALDDYEEGTWTPVLTDGTNNATTNTGNTAARYTKVGRFVHVNCLLTISSLGSCSGNMKISGLPYTISGFHAGHIGRIFNANITAGESFSFYGSNGQTYVDMYLSDSASGTTVVQHTELTATTELTFSMTYIVA